MDSSSAAAAVFEANGRSLGKLENDTKVTTDKLERIECVN